MTNTTQAPIKPSLAEACRREALLCDGAMGTQLIDLGLATGDCGMRWNEDRPADILTVHRAYRQAGCRLITTNSFGGSRAMLDRHAEGAHAVAWNLAAASIAAQAAGSAGWVLGDVGPFGDFLEPLGDTTTGQLEDLFREQIAALLEGGADAILVETMGDPAEAACATRAARSLSPLPVIVTFAFARAGSVFRTMMGVPADEALAAAFADGADIAGANCGTDLTLDDYRELGTHLAAAAAGRPTMLQPNAGAPRLRDGRACYDATPDDMAALARDLRRTGIDIIGGCCGTTPAHLAAMAAAIA
jgi:5-methyltetrahydrofolate--homocysteine methyltransferase